MYRKKIIMVNRHLGNCCIYKVYMLCIKRIIVMENKYSNNITITMLLHVNLTKLLWGSCSQYLKNLNSQIRYQLTKRGAKITQFPLFFNYILAHLTRCYNYYPFFLTFEETNIFWHYPSLNSNSKIPYLMGRA